MVAPGGSKPITGNNPIAVAVPTFGEFPFVFDISLSAVSGGKILVAAKNGEEIPLGWATDREGRPTTDPNVGFKGFLLPMGGHKGFRSFIAGRYPLRCDHRWQLSAPAEKHVCIPRKIPATRPT